jgi:hypothetical protein
MANDMVNIAAAPEGQSQETQAAAPQQQSQQTGQAPGGQQAAPSWHDSLPEEYKSDPSIKGFKDIADLVKSYKSASSMVGKDKVVIPGEKASADEWNAFYAKLGRPETVDQYKIKIDGVSPEVAKSFLEEAHKNGFNAKQVEAMVKWNDTVARGQVEQQQQAHKVEMENALNDYKKSLGGEDRFKSRVGVAVQGLTMTADESMRKLLDDTGLGSNPVVIEHFARIGEKMREDGVKGESGSSFGSDLADLEEKLGNLMSEGSPYWAQGHADGPRYRKQVSELHEQIFQIKSRMK